MGQSQCQGVFYPHPGGKLLDPLGFVQSKQLQTGAVGRFVPLRVEPAGHIGDGAQPFVVVVIKFSQHHAQLPLAPKFVFIVVAPQHRDRAGVRPHQVQQGLQGGRFAGPVTADKPHNVPGLQPEADIFQREGRVLLAQPLDIQKFHGIRLPIIVSRVYIQYFA